MGKWLIFIWGIVTALGLATEKQHIPDDWVEGLITALGILVAVLVVMLFAPRFAGMWAMGFTAGSVVSLVIAPIKGYPMLDIGFGVQALGGWGLMVLSTLLWDEKKEQALRKDPVAMMQRQVIRDTVDAVVRGVLVAQGEVHPLLTTIPEMTGPGKVAVEPGGPLVFTLDSSGKSHEIGLEHIKSVKQIEETDEYLTAGTLWFDLAPHIPFSISVQPTESQREAWLTLAPKQG